MKRIQVIKTFLWYIGGPSLCRNVLINYLNDFKINGISQATFATADTFMFIGNDAFQRFLHVFNNEAHANICLKSLKYILVS